MSDIQLKTPKDVATHLEELAEEYRITAEDRDIHVEVRKTAQAKWEALYMAAGLVRRHLVS